MANYNCRYDGPPILQTDPAFLSLYKELCPNLYNGAQNTSTCCDLTQLRRFNEDLSVPRQLMSRCPACFANFRSFLCDLTCHPDNAAFLLVTQDKPYTPSDSSSNGHHEDEDYSEDYEERENTHSKRKKRSIENEETTTSEAATTTSSPIPKPTAQIVRLTYHLTNYYSNNLYNSCKLVFDFFLNRFDVYFTSMHLI